MWSKKNLIVQEIWGGFLEEVPLWEAFTRLENSVSEDK